MMGSVESRMGHRQDTLICLLPLVSGNGKNCVHVPVVYPFVLCTVIILSWKLH